MKKAIYDIRHTIYGLSVALFIFNIISFSSFADDRNTDSSVSVFAEVDKSEINVGDRIKLKIAVENASGYEILFPEISDKLGNFSFIASRQVKTGLWRVVQNEREYILTIFDVGMHVIPPVEVKYRKPGDTEWHIMESPQVPIEVKSLLTENASDIKDLKDIIFIKPWKIYIILIFLILISTAAAGWILWQRRIKQGKIVENIKVKSAHEIAYEELQQLKIMCLPEKGLIKEYYFRLSDIVRHYLENRFSLRAPEMTTEEFLNAVKKSPQVITEHKKLLKDFLSHCDMVKFARYGPTPLEMLDSFRAAENFVEETRFIEEKETGE